MSGLSALFAPSGCVEIDLDANPIPVDGLAMACRSIEIVQAAEAAPYGSMVVTMADGTAPPLRRLQDGWEHVGQYVRIESTDDINIIRCWL